MDTSVLWVEWLGDERAKLKVMSSSAGGREAHIFCTKNCVKRESVQWGLPVFKKITIFQSVFGIHGVVT
jgi:hypothetical protein